MRRQVVPDLLKIGGIRVVASQHLVPSQQSLPVAVREKVMGRDISACYSPGIDSSGDIIVAEIVSVKLLSEDIRLRRGRRKQKTEQQEYEGHDR